MTRTLSASLLASLKRNGFNPKSQLALAAARERKKQIANLKMQSFVGSRFGKLTVLTFAGRGKHGLEVTCRCDCGNEKKILFKSIRRGGSRSCGCPSDRVLAKKNWGGSEDIIAVADRAFGRDFLVARLADQLTKSFNTDGCWTISRKPTKYGYTLVSLKGKPVRAHRLSWFLSGGPLEPGLVLDHICRNRACVNPSHLRQISNRENVLSGETITGNNLKKQLCKRGHFLSGDNLRLNSRGGRVCRACMTMHQRKWRAG